MKSVKPKTNAADIEGALMTLKATSEDEYLQSTSEALVAARVIRQNTMAYYHITYGNSFNLENCSSLLISRLMFPFMVITSLGKDNYQTDVICKCLKKENFLENDKIQDFFHQNVRNIGKK